MTHVHAKVFQLWTTLPNSTFEAGKLSHVGQFFFDDNVNLQVDNIFPTNVFSPYLTTCPFQMHPYTTNAIKDNLSHAELAQLTEYL